MNPIAFFEKQIEKYNEDSRCGFCWDFKAPLFESAINIQDLSEEIQCCVQVFLINLTTSNINTYLPNTFLGSKNCDYTFNLYVLLPSNMGLNNYQEKLGHDIEQSKWKTIFEPLQECMGCDAQLDFCELSGIPIQVINWRMDMVNNYLDNTYSGYRITATFRVKS